LKKVNNRSQITGQVRLVVQDEEPTIVPATQAYDRAIGEGLDLVLVSEGEIPVVKIMDYGKHLYKKQKNLKDQKKLQKNSNQMKEIRFHVNISDHDYGIKTKQISKFIGKNYRVKISIALRGREMAHKELAFNLANKLVRELDEVAKSESKPQFQGNSITTIMIPK
jgi:translation initiation factor IF-3